MKECLVTGIPRCGTTWLFRSLAGLQQGAGSPKGATLERLPIMKAHSLCPPATFGDPWSDKVREHVEGGGKCIFLYGDPILAVVSTKLRRWDHVHAANCGYFDNLDGCDISLADYFNYGIMFDTWMMSQHNVLCMRYETIWHYRDYVETFLGREVQWIPWRVRATQVDSIYPDMLLRLESTYKSLIRKIQNAPNFKLPGEPYEERT